MEPRDFCTLKPEEVLTLAIDIEEANGERLRTFADFFTDYAPEATRLLSRMASEEDQHRHQLEETYREQYGALQRTLGEEEVREIIEASDLDDAEHLIFDSFSLRRALETVHVAECQAQAFYWRAQEGTAEVGLRALYQELAGFENLHIQRVEKMLEEIGRLA